MENSNERQGKERDSQEQGAKNWDLTSENSDSDMGKTDYEQQSSQQDSHNVTQGISPNELVQNLTETQVLSEVRKVFENESLHGIQVEQIMHDSTTLAELYKGIRFELDKRLLATNTE